MKGKLYAIVLSVSMLAVLLAGCAGQKQENAAAQGQENTAEQEQENKAEQEQENAAEHREAEASPEKASEDMDLTEEYLAFLSGERTLVTSAVFGADDEEGNYDGVFQGEYTYPELKVAVDKLEGSDTITKYNFIDFGKDGTEELVVRFENKDPGFMNWVGIIHYQDGTLLLEHSYEDGYRTESALYETGKLKIGGSWGAGAYGMDYVDFNEKGEAITLFSCNEFYSSFATQVAYDLRTDGMGLETYEYYQNIMDETCEFEISEYVPAKRDGTGVKISVRNYSESDTMKACEEELLGEFEAMGAAVISNEEMDELCSVSGFDGPEVEWLSWEEKCTIVQARAFAYVYPTPEDYYYSTCDDDEYSMEVMISTNKNLTDVKVLSLDIQDYTDDGILKCAGTERDTYSELSPDKPLVIKLTFPGDMPCYGISYVDELGKQHAKAIQMSGYDGSVFLEDINLN